MLEFFMLVGAIVVAQVITAAISVAVVLNKHVLNWYFKKCMKMFTEIDYDNLYEEEES